MRNGTPDRSSCDQVRKSSGVSLQEQSVITSSVGRASGVHAPGHLGELSQVVDFDLVDAVLAETGAREKRVRLLLCPGWPGRGRRDPGRGLLHDVLVQL
ncbi:MULTISPECIES: transposase domain-containing protein [unclassified Streptomyces]|uniref:transposase domain-containing protein n=1 Tax=unclassified Streptomyces TaxID=2593676 RepID=UPI00343A9813